MEPKLKKDFVGIIPTDTIYGLVGPALSKKAVQRISRLKKRSKNKSFIILISSFKDLEKFSIKPSSREKRILKALWPGKISVVLSDHPMKNKFKYLESGAESLAFRLPRKSSLIRFLKKSGPLVAPSANPEGEKPAETVEEAKKYFDGLDFYIDGGRPASKPSTLVALKNGRLSILRNGAGKIPAKFRFSSDILV